MELFDMWAGLWVPLAICTLGIMGNCTCLCVLSRDRGYNPLFVVLKALVLCDLAMLVAALLQQVIPLWVQYAGCLSTVCLHGMGYMYIYTWPVVCIIQLTSAWLTLLVSLERYLAICRTLCDHVLSKICNIRLAIVGILTVAVIFNIPKFFEYKPAFEHIGETNMTMVVPDDTDQRSNLVYRYLYNTALYGLLVFALPIVCLLWLNINIMLHFKQAYYFTRIHNEQMRRKLKATQMPFAIFFLFIACNTLALISFVLDAVFTSSPPPWLHYFTGIANLVVMLNAAVNFVVFFTLGSRFKRLCCEAACICHNSHNDTSMHQESPIMLRRFNNITGRELTDDSSTYIYMVVGSQFA